MTISIPEQYQSLKTKLETIVKKTTIHYSLIASNYNPTIGSTVTLTLIVTDSNGDALEGVDATVTASDGNFTQLDGTNITSASSVTGTTNSSGQFTLTYACSEWGLITFSAKNHNVQISVTGWKQVQSLNKDRVFVYTDGKNAKIEIGGTFTTSTSAGEYTLATIDSAYKPDSNYVTNYTTQTLDYFPVYLGYNNNVVHLYKKSTSSSSISCYCTLFYPLKTPLY